MARKSTKVNPVEPKQLTWHVSDIDRILVNRIIERAIADGLISPHDRHGFLMDLEAVHANGCPLRLNEFSRADAFNFAHDVSGIRNCLDRDASSERAEAVFVRHFLPRFYDAAAQRKADAS